ncbi:MAG TPA: hypothetical protein VH575_04115 [Gemmataceae bacterium]
MRRLRGLCSLSGICLTAFTTLIAGTPHFHCICPDGHVKPFCLSFFSRTPCCCAGSCCASAPAAGNHPRKQTSCCCHAAQRQAEERGPQVRAAGCKKTLVDAEASNVTAPLRDVGQDTGIIVGVAASETFVVMPISASETGRLAPRHHRSPPPDLLTLLQHFNI